MSDIEVPDWARAVLALAASQQAAQIDDPRYNGWNWANTQSLLSGSPEPVLAWQRDHPELVERQKEWRQLAHALDPDTYDENGKHRG